MKRGATKEEIIRTTQELITRNGIRAVRVDEIAQTLGISKRTLYELFEDKTDLVSSCLSDMGRRQQQRIVLGCQQQNGNALHRISIVVNEYINSLFTVDSRFLTDIRRKQTFVDQFAEHRKFWIQELSQTLETCRQEELMLAEIDTEIFAECILNALFELRLNNISPKELRVFCHTLLRGAATQQGIKLIDTGV